MTLIDYYELLISDAHDLKEGGEISEGTCKHYKVRLKHLEHYLTLIGKVRIVPKNVNLLFVKSYETHLLKKLSRNYVNKQIQHLGKALSYAVMNEDIQHNPVNEYEFKYDRKIKLEFLTYEELLKLETCKGLSPYLDRTKDLYLFSCYTGLSYCDISKFTTKDIVMNKHGVFIVAQRTKTKHESVVPLLAPARAILEKYNSQLPRLSNQNYNRFLKKLLAAAGINKKLSTHSARKTFGMIMHNTYGVPIDTVSKMLGHSTVKTTQMWYVKTDFEKVANDMSKVVCVLLKAV